jgi:muconolactone delta-isomerase
MSKDDDHSWSVDERESTSDGGTRQSVDAIEQEKAEEEAVAKITRRETKQVQVWRVFTLFILVAVSVVVSTITFRLLQAQDVDEFEDSVSVAPILTTSCTAS